MPSKNKKKPSSKYPMVSVCTPTFNRRPFIPFMIECFKHQDYPKSRIEWIIVDDGTDKINDIIEKENIPQIKYFPVEEKMMLGKKRNFMHEKCSGSIIVYMDDDDYYPPERISHAVESLKKNPEALCAGSSTLNIYFNHNRKIYQFGPYGPNHATAGTFAFKASLLDSTQYDDDAALAEEKHFLKDYTIPFVQLEPEKTITVFSHIHNTFDKKQLLEHTNTRYVKETKHRISDFVKNDVLRDFITNKINSLLSKYEAGDPKYKPEAKEQMNKLIEEQNEKRKKEEEENGPIVVRTEGKEPQTLNSKQVREILNFQIQKIKELQQNINNLELTIENQKQEVETAELVVKIRDNRIKELEHELSSCKIQKTSHDINQQTN
jgi:glycosyltransferase involved in cell wall biosynthesis